MVRREKVAAERLGREYVSLTERGAVTHAAHQAQMEFLDMRERLDVARETYGTLARISDYKIDRVDDLLPWKTTP